MMKTYNNKNDDESLSGSDVVSNGIRLIQLERFDEALLCFNRAIDLNSENADAWYNKGRILAYFGDNNEALNCFNRAAKQWLRQGLLLLENDSLNDAFNHIERAYRADPNHVFHKAVSALMKKAANFEEAGQLNESVRCNTKALELEKEEGDI